MIKINLLGVTAPKPKEKAKAKAAAPVSMAVQLGSLVAALLVSFGIVGLFYLIWNRSIDNLRVELKKQQAEQLRLAAIRQENARYEQERQLLEQRIRTIQMLQSNRVGPTEFMNALSNVVNKTTSDLYLFSVGPQADRVVIHGQAGSANSVATLMSSMQASGYFEDVQLRQFYEDDLESLVTYKFNMDCAVKSASAAAAAPPAPAGGGARVATPPPRPRL
jgi:Tfp pilus assembly protein PilN